MVTSDQFAAKAVERRHLGITYEGNRNSEMCDAFVENTLKAAGGPDKNWEGSNTMLRKALTAMYPLDMAKKQGLLQRGMLLFIIAHDGGEPPRYQNDGLGNASHVGIYTDLKDPVNGEYVEVMHSSYTRGGVAASTLKNGWTHCGKYIGVDYAGSGTPAEDPAIPDVPSTPSAGNVLIGVRLRKAPEIKSGNVIVGLDPGDNLELTGATRDDGRGNFWVEGSIVKKGVRHRGWAVAHDLDNVYIRTDNADVQPYPVPFPEPAQVLYNASLQNLTADDVNALLQVFPSALISRAT